MSVDDKNKYFKGSHYARIVLSAELGKITHNYNTIKEEYPDIEKQVTFEEFKKNFLRIQLNIFKIHLSQTNQCECMMPFMNYAGFQLAPSYNAEVRQTQAGLAIISKGTILKGQPILTAPITATNLDIWMNRGSF
jgi:hypothetical protein